MPFIFIFIIFSISFLSFFLSQVYHYAILLKLVFSIEIFPSHCLLSILPSHVYFRFLSLRLLYDCHFFLLISAATLRLAFSFAPHSLFALHTKVIFCCSKRMFPKIWNYNPCSCPSKTQLLEVALFILSIGSILSFVLSQTNLYDFSNLIS